MTSEPIPANPIENMREARQELYQAVVTLPVDITEPLPSRTVDITERLPSIECLPSKAFDITADATVAAYVAKWREWHDRALRPWARAVMETRTGIDTTLKEPYVQWFTGTPEFGDKSFAASPSDPDWAAQYMASFDNRCKHQNALFKSEGRLVEDQQAMYLGLDLRRRALDFCEWLDRAIKRLETAFLPRDVELDAGGGPYKRCIVRMVYAGVPREKEVGEVIGEQLATLLSECRVVDFNDSKALDRFKEALPEIAPHLRQLRGPRGKPRRALREAAFAAMCSTSP